MPPAHPAPTDDQLKHSEEWKAKGNEAFRTGKFHQALTHYTEAIILNPDAQILYSNRAAAHLSIGQLKLALNDATTAISLDPRWPKAYRRKASVLDAMGELEEARGFYEKALEVIEEDQDMPRAAKKKEKSEVRKLIEAIEEKIRHPATGAKQQMLREDDMCGRRVLREVERRLENGEPLGSWPPVGTSCRRVWLSEMQYHNSMLQLREFHQREMTIPGTSQRIPVIFGRLQTLEELTTAMIEDIRVARFDQEALDKLTLCIKMEQQQRNAIGPNLSPRDTIAEYKRRLLEDPSQRAQTPFGRGTHAATAQGWDYVRPALQLTIRSSIMNGLLRTCLDPSTFGVDDFQRAVDLIQEARKAWVSVDGSQRGRTLEETFLRGVMVRLGEAKILHFQKHMIPQCGGRDDMLIRDAKAANRVRRYLGSISDIGLALIESFDTKPFPPEQDKNLPGGMDGWWGVYYTHYASPLAHGHRFVAFAELEMGLLVDAHALDSPTTGKRGPIAGDPKRLGNAAIHFATAAAWLPIDDPERAQCLWSCIFAMVRRGSYYMADLVVLRDMAQKATQHFAPWFPREYYPKSLAGKSAAKEVERSFEGSAPDRSSVPSPLTVWEDEVETDIDVIQEVLRPHMIKIARNQIEGGGCLVITEIIRGAWRERVERFKEREEAVGGMTVWEGVAEELRLDWEHMYGLILEDEIPLFENTV